MTTPADRPALLISGTVAPGFEPIRAAFEAAFVGLPGMGAALAIRHRGVPVVDLWGGYADAETRTPWSDDTLTVIFSCSKGLMSILVARLVQDGLLDYDDPVGAYWPEFAQAGKEGITVGDLLAHRAGLPAPAAEVTLDDVLEWSAMVRLLQAQSPLWEPGTAHAYHALTHGWLVGEVVRRITGMTVGQAFRAVVADPLRAEAWFGLPAELEGRVARLSVSERIPEAVAEARAGRAADDPAWEERAITLGGAFPAHLADRGTGFDDPRVHAAELPGGGAIATARALATIFSAAVTETDGVRLLDRATVDRATRVRSDGPSAFAPPPPWPRWGMGFELDSAARRFVTAAGFGHSGAGGQLAFAEPEHRVGFAFLTNRLEGDPDPRADSLVDALRAILE